MMLNKENMSRLLRIGFWEKVEVVHVKKWSADCWEDGGFEFS